MKAVVFDMDGVIFDSERLVLECWKKLAEEYGLEDMDNFYNKCIGTNMAETERLFKLQYGETADYAEFRKKSSEMFHSQYGEGRLPMKTGVIELLNFLKDQGFLIGLASSTREAVVKQELKDAGIIDYFDKIICGDMVKKSKPAPDIYLTACEQLGVLPNEAYAIEDSFNGMRAAHSAEMCAIMVPDMVMPDDEMKEIANYIFDDLLKVKDFLQNK